MTSFSRHAEPCEAVPGTLARMAVAAHLNSIKDEKDAQALAVRYQLMSRWTSKLVIHVRAGGEKVTKPPELRKVPSRAPSLCRRQCRSGGSPIVARRAVYPATDPMDGPNDCLAKTLIIADSVLTPCANGI